jgi:hypothetical protein
MPYVSKRPPSQRFWGLVAVVDEPGACWLWIGGTDGDGYGVFYVSPDRGHVKAPRYVFEMTTGERPGDLCVCHHCDTPACVRPSHLFLGTRSDNMQDAVTKGRHRYWPHGRIPASERT